MPLAGTQNSERVKCVEYKLLLPSVPEQNGENAYTKRDIENPNEHPSKINFRGEHVIEASTQHPYIHSPVPKCTQNEYKYNNKRTQNVLNIWYEFTKWSSNIRKIIHDVSRLHG